MTLKKSPAPVHFGGDDSFQLSLVDTSFVLEGRAVEEAALEEGDEHPDSIFHQEGDGTYVIKWPALTPVRELFADEGDGLVLRGEFFLSTEEAMALVNAIARFKHWLDALEAADKRENVKHLQSRIRKIAPPRKRQTVTA
ncbi:MAG TPA: hypothetical protein V6D29_09450 [Leptolyngbyaceae cyanobacterium]